VFPKLGKCLRSAKRKANADVGGSITAGGYGDRNVVIAMRTEQEKSFRQHLIICLGTALTICVVVELACFSLGVAPLFTPNLPLNEKMRFIREHRLGTAPIGVVSGASLALNDLDSDLLEDKESRPFINLGANGVTVRTAEHFYNEFAALYRIREVIFVAAPIEMRDTYRLDVDVPDGVFRRYVLGKMTMAEEFTYRDITGLMSYWRNWRDYHSRTAPSSMAFSKTGAVPLEIGRDTSDPRLWGGVTIEQNINCLHCVNDLAAFCRDVRSEGRPFTVVVGPIRQGVLAAIPKVRTLDADRRARIRKVAEACGASVFDVSDYMSVDDTCFANSIHLNAPGMRAMTEQFIRFRRGENIDRGTQLTCGTLDLAAGSSANQKKALAFRSVSE
jgi:hypothetical protein